MMYTNGKIKLLVILVTLFILMFFTVVIWSRHQGAVKTTPPIKIDTTPYVPTAMDVGHAVGISAGGKLSQMNAKDMNAYLDQMQALGVKWVRFDIEWGLVQYNSKDAYFWDNFDTLIAAINSRNMQGLAILLFTPEWARDSQCGGGAKCPPKNPDEFAKFASAAANRYKNQGIHYWEIWNEPNNYDFWATKTNCVAYTTLLKKTYTALKRADPDAFVVTGGLAPAATDRNNISPLDFVQCIYTNGGKNYFDALAHHPYTFPNVPSNSNDNAWGLMSKNAVNMRSIMKANGDSNKKIWMTEFGAPTNGPDPYWFISEAKQSEMIINAFSLYKTYDWAGPIFLYSLKDNGVTANTVENFFGLIRFDDSFKPAYFTVKKLISDII